MVSLQTLLYVLTLLLSLSIGLVVGLYISWLKARVGELTRAVVALSKRKADVPEPPKPRVFIADPDDPILKAKYERDRMREELNR